MDTYDGIYVSFEKYSLWEEIFDRIDYVELCVNETKCMQQEKSTKNMKWKLRMRCNKNPEKLFFADSNLGSAKKL